MNGLRLHENTRESPQEANREGEAAASDGVELVTLDRIQVLHTCRVLKHFGGDKTRAAQVLGISRATLYRLLARSRGMDA